MLQIKFMNTSCEIALMYVSQNTFDDLSTLISPLQIKSHCLNQCWPRSISPCGVIMPLLVNSCHGELTHCPLGDLCHGELTHCPLGDLCHGELTHCPLGGLCHSELTHCPLGDMDARMSTLALSLAWCPSGNKPWPGPILGKICGAMMLWYHQGPVRTFWWISVKLQYLQSVSNGDIAVLH